MSAETLVRPLFEGPVDVVGDVHGEIDALRDLLFKRLGYQERGQEVRHPEGRRLVFVGDLGDRGPDSPGVVALVRRLVETKVAQCVLGNHEFNALREETERGEPGHKTRPELSWLFPNAPPFRHHDHAAGRHFDIEQKTAYGERAEILDFFRSLPIALERPDLRVVHACWEQGMIDLVRRERDTLEVYLRHRQRLTSWLAERDLDPIDRKLVLQNHNPIKLLTSGPEVRHKGGKREERRVPWWEWASQPRLCVFGHYWRGLLPGDDELHLFAGYPHAELVGPGNNFCVDFSAGKRFKERLGPGYDGTSVIHLGALRLPEHLLFLDNQEGALPVRPWGGAGA